METTKIRGCVNLISRMINAGSTRCRPFLRSQIHLSHALGYYLPKAAAVYSVSKRNALPPSLVQDLEFLLLAVKHLEFHIKGV